MMPFESSSLGSIPSGCRITSTASGPRMDELRVRYAHGWSMAGGGTQVETVRAKYEEFAAACRRLGRKASEFDVAKLVFIGLAADAAGASAMLEELAVESKTTSD